MHRISFRKDFYSIWCQLLRRWNLVELKWNSLEHLAIPIRNISEDSSNLIISIIRRFILIEISITSWSKQTQIKHNQINFKNFRYLNKYLSFTLNLGRFLNKKISIGTIWICKVKYARCKNHSKKKEGYFLRIIKMKLF